MLEGGGVGEMEIPALFIISKQLCFDGPRAVKQNAR
jgi:hypothetical protein